TLRAGTRGPTGHARALPHAVRRRLRQISPPTLACGRSAYPWCNRTRQLVGSGASAHPRLCHGAAMPPGARFLEFLLRQLRAGGALEEVIDMEVLYPNSAGLDVHKDTLVACSRRMTGSKVEREVRTFATTTRGLFALSEWLSSLGATHIAMEATGVYWQPVR